MSRLSAICWSVVFALFVPIATIARFAVLSKPVIDVHPFRQCQTALTIDYFVRGRIGFFDYSSPLDGKLWNYVREFPLYQWVCAQAILFSGLPLETVSRLLSLLSFAVSVVALWFIARDLLGKEGAAWAALLYYVSPFTIIFSRTCQVDFFALALELCSLWAFLAAFRCDKRHFVPILAAATLTGMLAALCKITVWYAPTVVVFVWLASRWKNVEERRYLLAALASLLMQAAIGGAWSIWSERIYGPTDPEGHAWLFGTLAERISWGSWRQLLGWIASEILYLWMVPLVILGIVLAKEKRRHVAIALFLVFLPILVFFHVSVNHDYYLIVSAPFVFLIAAVGMVRLQSLRRAIAYPALALLFAFATYRAAKIKYVIGIVYNRIPVIRTIPEWLKRATTAEDVVFAEPPAGPCTALYSERLVNLRPVDRPETIGATALYVTASQASLAVVNRYPKVALDYRGDVGYLYRVRDTSDFALRPGRALLAADESLAPTHRRVAGPTTELELCHENKAFEALETPSGAKTITVTAAGRGSLYLPAKKYLYVPTHSALGCRMTLRFD